MNKRGIVAMCMSRISGEGREVIVILKPKEGIINERG